MAKLEVIRGHDKWVHMRWLSRCDPKMLAHKRVEPWYGKYKDRCSLQAIPNKDESTTGDKVSTGDQFSQRGRGALEHCRSSEEKLQQKWKESEALIDQLKFEWDSEEFDDEEMEQSDTTATDNASFQSMPLEPVNEDEEQSMEQPRA